MNCEANHIFIEKCDITDPTSKLLENNLFINWRLSVVVVVVVVLNVVS